MRRCALIVNPAAANGRTAKRWPSILRSLVDAGFDPKVYETSAPGTATSLTRQALLEGHETIIVAGGDGTINEAVNGFFEGEVVINPGAKMGIACAGTGADFIRSIGLPAGERAVPILREADTVKVDVGFAIFIDMSGAPVSRYFINFADLGLGGETVAHVNGTSKAMGGFASFLCGAVVAILCNRGKEVEISFDGDVPIQQRIGDIVVANGRYFGGGMHVAPAASLVDGLFDVFVLRDVSKRTLLLDLLPRVYRGAHVGHPDVYWKRASRVTVTSLKTVLVDLDGELVGTAKAELRVLTRALPLLVSPNREHVDALR